MHYNNGAAITTYQTMKTYFVMRYTLHVMHNHKIVNTSTPKLELGSLNTRASTVNTLRTIQAARIIILRVCAQARKPKRDGVSVAGQATGGDGQRRGDQCILTAGDIREAAYGAAAARF